MNSAEPLSLQQKGFLYRRAWILAAITVFYNVIEGLVSVLFGLEDKTLSLFGFGLDSFVEVISGAGVWHMTKRFGRNNDADPDTFEQLALRITGIAFYILAFGLIITSVLHFYLRHKPDTTFWGIVVAGVSILSMWLLMHSKIRVGKQLKSQAILADAVCTKTCIYLSVVLLAASMIYEFTGFGGVDSIGTIVIAILSFKEGREAFQKAKGIMCSCKK